MAASLPSGRNAVPKAIITLAAALAALSNAAQAQSAPSAVKENGMTNTRAALAALAVFAALTATAQAQDWPTRPITLIVPFSAGGGVDASARLQALVMGEILGQTIVVENVGAAAGTVGTG